MMINSKDDVEMFRKKNSAERYRIEKIIGEGEININAQLVKDFIAMRGLDLEADKEEIILICQEIGVEPKVVGIEIEEQAPDINRANIDMPQIDNDGRDEK